MKFEKRKFRKFDYLLTKNMKLFISGDVTDISLKPWKFITKCFKIVTSLLFNRRTNLTFQWCLEEYQRNKKFEMPALYYFTLIYSVRQQMPQYTSNLIHIASCFFIPAQYDVYWPLSNAVLSGATSEWLFHNRNIFIH